MSIVAQLVKKMNGTIQVESTVGEGSSFTVVLPFAIDHDPPAAAEKTPPAGDLRGIYAEKHRGRGGPCV